MPSTWDIPYERNSFFTGRNDLFLRIKEGKNVALAGPSGIGKTELALEYAYRYRDEYQAVFWVDASVIMSADIRDLAATLRTFPEEAKWLLILDQVESLTVIGGLVPQESKSGGHVLLTTSIIVPKSIASTIYVPPLSDNDAALFLLHRAHILSIQASLKQAPASVVRDAIAIAKELRGVPLAFDLAGGILETTQMSLSDYLHQFKKKKEYLSGKERSSE